MYGIWAYLSTFSRVWAFIWKLGSGSGYASGWKVGSRIRINVMRIHNTYWGGGGWDRELTFCPLPDDNLVDLLDQAEALLFDIDVDLDVWKLKKNIL
jgi:hypothetical protein